MRGRALTTGAAWPATVVMQCSRVLNAGAAYHRALMATFLDDLRAVAPQMRLLTDEADRESFRRDETAHFEPGLPLAVALPTSTEEVATILRTATAHGTPVVPRGAGSERTPTPRAV